MKATLTFTLPDESYDFDNAISGTKWSNVVDDIKDQLREMEKYWTEEKFKEQGIVNNYDFIYYMQKFINETMYEHGVNLEY
jgi:hypothetical protein